MTREEKILLDYAIEKIRWEHGHNWECDAKGEEGGLFLEIYTNIFEVCLTSGNFISDVEYSYYHPLSFVQDNLDGVCEDIERGFTKWIERRNKAGKGK